MICLNPYVTPEQERIATKARRKTELREDQILFRMRKARIEATYMAPTEVEDAMSPLHPNKKELQPRPEEKQN